MGEVVIYCRVGNKDELTDEVMKAVGYVRTNCSDQSKVEKQIRDICEYANNKGFKIVEWYIDEAMSGLEKEPPAYSQMVKEEKAKVILVTQPDRISRDMMLLALRLSRLSKKGISVHSVESGE